MKKLFFLIALTYTVSSCTQTAPSISGSGNEVITFRAIPFDITDVKLLDGPFLRATKLNEIALINYEPDRFLAKFRIEAGLERKAEHYGGWEGETIAGHSLGHYLTAICLMYQTTKNDTLLERAKYIVDELAACQNADGDGYIGAFPTGKQILENEVAKGDIRSRGFDLNGIWVPYYTQHKVMDGLYHAYHLCGIEKALTISTRFADWLYSIVKDLNDEQIQTMLDCEHGGINESLAELYQVTQNEKYLKMSYLFHHKEIIDSLSHEVDVLSGKHANTQIPKFVGTARRYELTGDRNDRNASENFWNRVTHHHSYVTGGNGNQEYFGAPDKLRERLSTTTTETCNVYNMLKLSSHLFTWSGNTEVLDYYERALLNQILSSQNPTNGRVVYNLSLEMGGYKEFQEPEWFTCCIGTGMENHSKYARNIYYHNHEELFVGQFIASELNWTEKGIKVIQTTQYPNDQETHIEIEGGTATFALNIRYPYWAKNGMSILLNGKQIDIESKPGHFITINRTWENGDRINIKLPFSLRLETMPDDSNRVAVMYGPLVMAGILGNINDDAIKEALYVPILKTEDRNPNHWLQLIDGENNCFITNQVGYPREIKFQPFYSVYNKRYSVYFDLFSNGRWEAYKQVYKKQQQKQKQLETATIDFIQLGEMQPERDHNFESTKSWVGELKLKKYREVDSGGEMTFYMNIRKGEKMSLVTDFWSGFPGTRTFEIYVNDQLIGTENIADNEKSRIHHKVFELPDELNIKNRKVKIKIVPHKGQRVGPLFSFRMVNSDYKNSVK